MVSLIVADESVDMPIVRDLREAGWSVWSILEEYPSSSDEHVIEIARQKRAILLTMDGDFGELAFERGVELPQGIIFVRNKKLSLARASKLVLETLMAGAVTGNYITLTRSAKRSRALPNRKVKNA